MNTVGRTINNIEVTIGRNESKFQSRELEFTIGKVEIRYLVSGS